MKTLTMLFVCFYSFANFSNGQTVELQSEKAIRKIMNQFQEAVMSAELHSLDNIFSSKAKIYEQGGVDESWAIYRDGHLGKEINEMKNLDFNLEVVDVISQENMAMSRGNYSLTAMIDEREISSSGLVTVIIEKIKNNWQVVHWQFSRSCHN